MQPKVLIADDHSIVRMGLCSLIKQLNDSIVDEVANCNDLMKQLKLNSYTHLILDLIMPDGNAMELIESITKSYSDLSILIHSMQPFEVYGKLMAKFQIHSYLHKGASELEIKKHIEYFILSKEFKHERQIEKNDNPFSSLSIRELEVLHYLLNGYRTKEISNTLGLKMNTISTMKTIIFEKVNAENFTHLLQLAHVYQISY